MRMLPFFKPKKGFMLAGGGVETSSGGGGGGGGGFSINFSTDEQEVGTWVDGSTVYMKTYHQTNGGYDCTISELTDANSFVIDAFASGIETQNYTWVSYDSWALSSTALTFKFADSRYTSERYATVLYIKKGE